MNQRERVLTALKLKIPDKVPYIEAGVDVEIGKRLFNRNTPIYEHPKFIEEGFNSNFNGFTGWNYYTPVELCSELHLDAWGYIFIPKNYAEYKKSITENSEKNYMIGGSIKNKNDLKKIKLADLKNSEIFEYINNYINKYKKDYAVFAFTNLGIDPVIFSLGIEKLSYAIHDEIDLIEELLDIYIEWIIEAVTKLCELDFDFVWFGEDIAYNTGLMFSPDFYREICIPRFKKVVSACTKPFIYHSDGNYLEVIEDLLSLGIKGLHPLETLSVDIFDFKKKYGDRVCVIGNIDINTLSLGSREETYSEVEYKVKELSKGGGYIMSSSNTITSYCKLENIKTMVEAFEKFR